MDYKDYYQVLGVNRDATEDEIKRAYRKLARKYHPDVSDKTDAEEKFKEVGEAYEVLKDPEKRAAYNQLGPDWKSGQDFRPPPNWDAGFEFSGGGYSQADDSRFSDFFETLFGAAHFDGSQARRPETSGRGENHHAKILVALEDSYLGAARSISLRVPELTDDGHLTVRDRTLNVRVPKGIKQGQQIRLAGQGGPALGGGKSGDLYLEVEFRPHRLYRSEGADIYMDLPVAPWEAALGATVKVPTPSGTVDLKLPSGSANGRRLRLKARGLPGKTAGDLYVDLRIALPPADSEKAKSIYQEMAKELDFNPREDLGV